MRQKEFAALVGVTETTVMRWLREGMPHQRSGKHGRSIDIDPAVSLPWLKDRGIRADVRRTERPLVEDGEVVDLQPGDSSAAYASARAKREDFAARMAELNYKQAAGELMDANQVKAELADACTRFRVACEALPYRIGVRVAPVSDENEVVAIMNEEIELFLQELSDSFADMVDGCP